MIGIMTYHAAHNYGSVLQAYATQRVLEGLGHPNEIINYRLPNQRLYYNHFYSPRFGMKNLARRLMLLPEHFARRERSKKFEAFIAQRLKLTDREYTNYPQLRDAGLDYPVLLSGSDQVWNRHCRAEFWTEPRESILGYYLAFGREDARRVSFSSSIGGMTRQEMEEFVPLLKRYESLSVREEQTADMLSDLLDRPVENTLDPTLMLDGDSWQLEGTYRPEGKFIFVYTLGKYRAVQRLLREVKALGERLGLSVICNAPFSPVHVPGVKAYPQCGPLDFLSHIRAAALVITDSFHGTAFSLNFGTPFYSVDFSGGRDQRKNQLLAKVGLAERIVSLPDLRRVERYDCDFARAHEILSAERQRTLDYLKRALGAI